MTWTVKAPHGAEATHEGKDFMVHDEQGNPVAVCLSGRKNAEIVAQSKRMWELLNQIEALWDDCSEIPMEKAYSEVTEDLKHLRLETQALLRLVTFPESEPKAPKWQFDDSALEGMSPEEITEFMKQGAGSVIIRRDIPEIKSIPDAAFDDALLYGMGVVCGKGKHVATESFYKEQNRAEDATYESEGGSHMTATEVKSRWKDVFSLLQSKRRIDS